MITPTRSVALAILATALAGVSTANASLLLNGSFEANTPGYAGVNTVNTYSTVTSWTNRTLSGTSELGIFSPPTAPTPLGTNYPVAVDGAQYLVFNTRDSAAGTITIFQDFATTIGESYDVRFTVGASSNDSIVSPNQPVSVKAEAFNVIASATSGGAINTVLTGGTAVGETGQFFTPVDFTFVATGTTSRLIFTDMTASTTGVDTLLDGVSVAPSAVPEPATYAAFAGLGVLIMAASRRRRTVRELSLK